MSNHLNTSETGTLEQVKNTLTAYDLQARIQADAEEIRSMPTTSASGQDPAAAMLQAARIEPTDELSEPPARLSIVSGDSRAIVGTAGNFGTVIGAAKSRKSFVIGSFVSAWLNPSQLIMGCVQASPSVDKPGVLLIDTEQGRYHVLKSVKRICSMSGIDKPEHLHTYALRPLETNQRLEAIRYAIKHTPGIGLVVIDGIRDIVFDINSAEEATKTATLLLRWTEQYDFHLLTVLHVNKGNSEARGHLGTELINKAETVIRVSKDPNDKAISIVAPEQCRDRDFEPFAFSINEANQPYRVDSEPGGNSSSGRPRKPTAADLKPQDIETILRRAFANSEQLQYRQLQIAISEASEYIGMGLARARAEGLICRVEKEGFLTKYRPDKARYDVYQLSSEKLPF